MVRVISGWATMSNVTERNSATCRKRKACVLHGGDDWNVCDANATKPRGAIMPMRALRPCSANPFCPNRTTDGGPCRYHAQELDRQRGHSRARGYSRRWERRAALFRQRYPLCGMRPDGQVPVMSQCYDQGIVRAADQVDHVVPHRGDQVLFWDEQGNWQSLCRSCGSLKTRRGL